MAKELKYGTEARAALEAGVDKLAKHSKSYHRTKRKKRGIR